VFLLAAAFGRLTHGRGAGGAQGSRLAEAWRTQNGTRGRGRGDITETKNQSPNTGQRANNTPHK